MLIDVPCLFVSQGLDEEAIVDYGKTSFTTQTNYAKEDLESKLKANTSHWPLFVCFNFSREIKSRICTKQQLIQATSSICSVYTFKLLGHLILNILYLEKVIQ